MQIQKIQQNRFSGLCLGSSNIYIKSLHLIVITGNTRIFRLTVVLSPRSWTYFGSTATWLLVLCTVETVSCVTDVVLSVECCCWDSAAADVCSDSSTCFNNSCEHTSIHIFKTITMQHQQWNPVLNGEPSLKQLTATIINTSEKTLNIKMYYNTINIDKECAVYAVVVCLCVSMSVTLRYCIKTAKHRITQTMPHESPGDTSFLTPKFTAKFEWDHPLWGWRMQVRWVKIGHFWRKTRYNSKTVQDRHIVCIKVE